MDVSIIIINYNTYNLVVNCISSIKHFTPNSISYEIIIVDNNSTHIEVENLKTIPKIKLILSDQNLGFGAGNNLGVNNACGKFLLLLNSDTVFVEDCLSVFISQYWKLQKNYKIGVLGVQLVDRNFQPVASYYSFPKLRDVIFDRYRTFFKLLFNKIGIGKDSTLQIENQFTDGKVDYIIGADMFLMKSVYDSQNGFDERFFMYFEEADMQIGLAEKGYMHFFITNARIIHLGGGSQKNEERNNDYVPNQRRIMIHVSRNRYFRKHLIKWQHYLYIISEISLIPLRIISPKHSLKENLVFVKECILSL